MNQKLISINNWLEENNCIEELYNAIARGDAKTRLATGIFGWISEDEFKKECLARNFVVRKAEEEQHDCIVNGIRTQVKFTTLRSGIDIRNKRVPTKRRYVIGDFGILAIKTDKWHFIPAERLVDNKKTDTGLIMLKREIKLKDYEDCEGDWSVFVKESKNGEED